MTTNIALQTMPLNNHAIARTLIPAVGAALAGAYTANPVAAAFAYTALSGATNELISQNEGKSHLADGFRKAITELEKELENSTPVGIGSSAEQVLALKACEQAIIDAEPSELTQLLAQKASRSNTAHIIHDKNLETSTRELAENYLALALNHWQKNLSANSSTVQALRKLLAEHQLRLQNLATAGLDYGSTIPYVQNEMPPSQMFRPESSVLRLIGRERELLALHNWCSHEVNFAITARAAPGGTGKTRLALQLIHELQEKGWLAGFVKQQEVLSLLIGATLPRNILLVLDYADYRSADLEALLAVAEQLSIQGQTLRLLLLARPDSGWWKDCERTLKGNSKLYKQIRTLPPKLIALSSPQNPTAFYREQLLRRVANATKSSLPSDAEKFRMPENSTPLMWMMSAYRFLQTNRQLHTEQVIELCEQMVMEHEQRYIKNKLGSSVYLEPTMQALSLFTLAGGVKCRSSCLALLKKIPALENTDESNVEKILETLLHSYPNFGGIDALRPDLLGEYLVENKVDLYTLNSYFQWLAELVRQQDHKNEKDRNSLNYIVSARATIEKIQEWHDRSKTTELFEHAFINLHPNDSLDIAAADMQADTRLRETSLWIGRNALKNPKNSKTQRAILLSGYSVDLKNMGDLTGSIENIECAIDTFKEVVRETKSTDPEWGYLQVCYADCCMNASSRYYEAHCKGDASAISKSVKHARDVVDFYQSVSITNKESDVQEKMINAYTKLAGALQGNNEKGTALRAAKRAHKLAISLDTKNHAMKESILSGSYASLGKRYWAYGAYDLAENNFRDAIKLKKTLIEKGAFPQKYRVSITLLNLARMLEEQKKISLAIVEAEDSLRIRAKLYELSPLAHARDLEEIQSILRRLREKKGTTI